MNVHRQRPVHKFHSPHTAAVACGIARPKPGLRAVQRAFAEVPFRINPEWPRVSVAVCSLQWFANHPRGPLPQVRIRLLRYVGSPNATLR
jgi:hypothetical protein